MSIKVGIIGLGHIGLYHIKALRKTPELELVAVCDTNSRLKKIAPPKITFYNKAEKLLEDKRVETVIIATPNSTHFNLGCKSLNFKKNVIMEKPAGISIKEFKELDARFKKNKKQHIYYAFHAAKALEVSWFKKHYNKERLGPITSFVSNFYDPYITKGKVKKEAKNLQDCWIDSGVNALSVLSEITDLELKKREMSAVNSAGTIIQAVSYFSFPVYKKDYSGIGSIDTNWSLNKNFKRTLLGFAFSGMTVELNHSRQKAVFIDKNGKEKIACDFNSKRDRLYNHYSEVFKDYLKAVRFNSFNSSQAAKIYKNLFSV